MLRLRLYTARSSDTSVLTAADAVAMIYIGGRARYSGAVGSGTQPRHAPLWLVPCRVTRTGYHGSRHDASPKQPKTRGWQKYEVGSRKSSTRPAWLHAWLMACAEDRKASSTRDSGTVRVCPMGCSTQPHPYIRFCRHCSNVFVVHPFCLYALVASRCSLSFVVRSCSHLTVVACLLFVRSCSLKPLFCLYALVA